MCPETEYHKLLLCASYRVSQERKRPNQLAVIPRFVTVKILIHKLLAVYQHRLVKESDSQPRFFEKYWKHTDYITTSVGGDQASKGVAQ